MKNLQLNPSLLISAPDLVGYERCWTARAYKTGMRSPSRCDLFDRAIHPDLKGGFGEPGCRSLISCGKSSFSLETCVGHNIHFLCIYGEITYGNLET